MLWEFDVSHEESAGILGRLGDSVRDVFSEKCFELVKIANEIKESKALSISQ